MYRFPCIARPSASRREKQVGDDPWRSNDFTARLHVRFGGRPTNFLDKIRTYPGRKRRTVEYERGQRLLGGGRKKRKKEGETERNTQINRPFPLVSPLWAERNTDTGQCNRENRRPLFCHISRVLVFWTTIRAGNE